MFTKGGMVKSNFNKKYYSKFRRNNETLLDTVERIDSKIMDERFMWLCDRDILSSDMIINKATKTVNICMSDQKLGNSANNAK